MKCVINELDQDLKEIEIEIFSDLHIGSRKCDYDLIQNRVNRVKENPSVYAVILGDLLNNSTKASVGDVYEEELSPMAQIQTAMRIFAPIKDKILGVTSGNHERRSYKTDGTDLTYFFCSELGITDKYDYTACLLFVKVGRLTGRNAHRKYVNEEEKWKQVLYTIYMTHGDGNGGRTVGGKANGLEKRGQIVNADIVITGHTHSPMTFRNSFYEIDKQNCYIREKEQVFVNASATLKYESYAELYGLKPNSVVSPKIMLNGRKHEILVSL